MPTEDLEKPTPEKSERRDEPQADDHDGSMGIDAEEADTFPVPDPPIKTGD